MHVLAHFEWPLGHSSISACRVLPEFMNCPCAGMFCLGKHFSAAVKEKTKERPAHKFK